VNGFIKLSSGTVGEGWSLALSAYHADWNATDQVPERAIDIGLIRRFGNIDPYLGGPHHAARVHVQWRGR
jgi:hypothetical protein